MTIFHLLYAFLPLIFVITTDKLIAHYRNKKYYEQQAQHEEPEQEYVVTEDTEEKTENQSRSDETPKARKEPETSEPAEMKYPVRCPKCKATAYPKEDGTCQYCGAVLVDIHKQQKGDD